MYVVKHVATGLLIALGRWFVMKSGVLKQKSSE